MGLPNAYYWYFKKIITKMSIQKMYQNMPSDKIIYGIFFKMGQT